MDSFLGAPPTGSGLVLIDFQEWIADRFTGGPGRAAACVANRLANAFRLASRPVFHVRYLMVDGSDGGPDSPLTRFVDEIHVSDRDRVVSKFDRSAFEGTDLAGQLLQADVREVYVGGIVTDAGVRDTVLDALRLSLEVTVIEDSACGTSTQAHVDALAWMSHAGAKLTRMDTLGW